MRKKLRRMALLAGLAFVLAVPVAMAANADVSAFKRAVCQVESGCDDAKVGLRGERGRYQFMEATWKQYTTLPHVAAHVRANSEMVMDKHCRWMALALKKLGRETTVRNMALLHNAGYGNMERATVPAASYGYADRVAAIYGALMASGPAGK